MNERGYPRNDRRPPHNATGWLVVIGLMLALAAIWYGSEVHPSSPPTNLPGQTPLERSPQG